MPTAKGVSAPFSFALYAPARRAAALMTQATADFRAGRYADALITAESLCRSHPAAIAPAVLRARVLQEVRPTMAPRAWDAAWARDPLDATLQDVMLRSWIDAGSARRAAEQGVVFLPQRWQAGTHESILQLLERAGVERVGACWRDGDGIELRCVGSDGTMVLAECSGTVIEQAVPAGGALRIAVPDAQGVWSVAFKAGPLLQGSPVVFDEPAPYAGPAPIERGVDIVIPVYKDARGVQACINSVLASLPLNKTPANVIVVNDASPEHALVAWLEAVALQGRIRLLHNRFNLGFIEAVNQGIAAGRRDPLMLNADTLVHGNWIDRLHASLHAAPDIASVMPWSNNGEIANLADGESVQCNAQQLAAIDAAASSLRMNDLEVPTNSGFAMLMRRAAVDAIGGMDGAALTRGYLEEVDWCLRARLAGWTHRLATRVFVAHRGSASFGLEKRLRVRQNRAVIAARYPDYYRDYSQFLAGRALGDVRDKVLAAIEKSGHTLKEAKPARQPTVEPGAALPSGAKRIGVWDIEIGSEDSQHVLALARRLSAGAGDTRLLVFGSASSALVHTGVVDTLPAPRAGEDLLSDTTMASLAGCTQVLTAKGVTAALAA